MTKSQNAPAAANAGARAGARAGAEAEADAAAKAGADAGVDAGVGRGIGIPPRAEWPEAPAATEGGEVLTDVILTTFRLNARLLEAAQDLAVEGELTAAWWQVLGGILDEPRSVADVGRRMGMTRQGVQRIADVLVERGLAEYRPNPAHRRAKLLACTEAGYWAIRRISIAQHPWAARISSQIGTDDLRAALATMQTLVATLEADRPDH